MSLDVYLTLPACEHCGSDEREVYDRNITHNLGAMASYAGLYDPLWYPDESGHEYARNLIEPLRSGIERLRAEPDFFRKFNPSNGWGDYEGLLNFAEEYLAACERYPNATVGVSR